MKVSAINYYVSALTGSNFNNGRSPSTAFATLSKFSFNSTFWQPGDSIFIMNGVYGGYSSPTGDFVMVLTRSGSAANPVVFINYPGHTPEINFNGWNAIGIFGSYIEINGLKIRGNNSNVNILDALNQPRGCNNPGGAGPDATFSGNGISIEGTNRFGTGHTHHITIRNCEVFECGGGGIGAMESDYITIENNRVYNNSWYSIYANSGISIFHFWNFDANVTTYRNIIRNNICYGNEMFVPWPTANCTFTDGNGIIIDDFRNTQASSTIQGQVYGGKTLIANNIVYRNGGRGIHIYKSDSVTIINNTSYKNCKTPSINEGEITIITGDRNRIVNNVMFARETKRISTASGSTNLYENNNLMYNSSVFGYFNDRDIIADPKFIDSANNNFRLLATSPGINTGSDSAIFFATTDFVSNTRPSGVLPEPGAYEFTGLLPQVPEFTRGNLAVLRVGNGSSTLNTGSFPAEVLEYTNIGGATGISVPLSATALDFVFGGSTVSTLNEGQLTLSSDGRYLSAVGYSANAGTTESLMRAGDKRIARIDYALDVDKSTTILGTNAYSSTNVKGAVTDNGSSFWVSAATGFRSVNMSSNVSAPVSNAGAARSLNRLQGKSYYVSFRAVTINQPPAANESLPGTDVGSTSQGFVLLDVEPGAGYSTSGYDLLYRAEPDGGIRKFFYDAVAITWVDAGLYNPAAIGGTGVGLGFTSITGRINAIGRPELYALKGTGSDNYFIRIVDRSPRTANWLTTTGAEAPVPLLLAQAGSNYVFRGVAFTPTKYGINDPFIVLPVRLSSFEAVLFSDDVLIQWRTASESNVQNYTIERSADGRQFEAVGVVAASNNNNGAAYNFTDRNIAEGVYHYRLKITDRDGKMNFSKTIVIRKRNASNDAISIFPNPVQEQLNVSYPKAGNQSTLLLLDLSGRTLLKKSLAVGSTQLNLDVAFLVKGIYTLVLADATGTQVAKFIK